MQWQNNPFVLPIFIAGCISVLNALVVLQRRRVTGSLPLLGMLTAVGWWSFAYALELSSPQQSWELFWSKMEYIGIVNVPVLFIVFALEYSGYRKKIQRRALALFWIIPLVCLILVWTNDFHGLIWSHISQDLSDGYFLLSVDHGIAFWIWAAYSYLCLLAGLIILIIRAVSSQAEFRLQAGILVLGALVSGTGNLLYLFKLIPVPNLDTTPISFVLSMLIYSVGLFRFGILDILQIAGETVLQSMDDVVIVLNSQGFIVFINQVFDYYFGISPQSLIGKFAETAFAAWPELRALTTQGLARRNELDMNLPNFGLVFFDVTISKIRGADNRELGRAIILDDVTERRHAEKRIADKSVGGSAEIPLILVYRTSDEKIVEVNRTFLLKLGYDRRDVVGRSLLELGIWDPYRRADFLRALSSDGTLKEFQLPLTGQAGVSTQFKAFANQTQIQDERYTVIMAQEEDSKQ